MLHASHLGAFGMRSSWIRLSPLVLLFVGIVCVCVSVFSISTSSINAKSLRSQNLDYQQPLPVPLEIKLTSFQRAYSSAYLQFPVNDVQEPHVSNDETIVSPARIDPHRFKPIEAPKVADRYFLKIDEASPEIPQVLEVIRKNVPPEPISSPARDVLFHDPIVLRELGDEASLLKVVTKDIAAEKRSKCPPISTATLVYDPECYALQRDSYEFSSEPLEQLNVTTFSKLPHPSGKVAKGVIVIMCSNVNDDILNLKRILRRLDSMMFPTNPYPVAVFHENFTDEMMDDMQNCVRSTIHFVQIAFKIPANLEPISKFEPILVKHWTNNGAAVPFKNFHTHLHGLVYYNKRKSMGYYHMCRFFAGAGYTLPFFDNFDFVMRLDSDSDILGRLPDYFEKMVQQNKSYLYNKDFIDGGDVTAGLWNFVHQYVQENKINATFLYNNNTVDALGHAWSSAKYPDCSRFNASQANMTARDYNGVRLVTMPCIDNYFAGVPSFYTNFEVVNISILRSVEYQSWFKAVDATGSIFLHRWGDAPLRFLGLAMHVPPSEIAVVSRAKVIHRGVDKSQKGGRGMMMLGADLKKRRESMSMGSSILH
eukprot:TRINITY_DN54263_c0_g1_i1.p1 TRINITY_DN54263_c0_g1~~TRINITY_DN54263_c0_g1_i1.p1  ORF type:complete len:594 (-),score=135.62 TRINITY_DN54263_c0_g1_i1:60-1841(-)